jgi:MSHA biogenesis protein MshQ
MIKKILLLLFFPLSLFAWKMESGTVQLNHTSSHTEWVQVTLAQSYATPPLIFSLTTSDGGDPCALRIRTVTNSSFEILQLEPSNQDGPHMQMTVHYLAIESGEHFLPDGTRIVAGKISTTAQQAYKNVGVNTSWESISFANAFDATPIVLGMIQTLNNEEANIPSDPSEPFLTTVINEVKSDGFKIALERSEVAPGDVNNSETIAYMAITNNTNGTIPVTSGGILYETASKNDVQGWTNGCYSYNFVNTYSDAPNVLSTKQTRSGDNGGWFRRCSLDENATGLTVDEDKYNDSERSHIKETAGIVVFEKDFAFDSSTLAPAAEYRMDECYWLGICTFDVMY